MDSQYKITHVEADLLQIVVDLAEAQAHLPSLCTTIAAGLVSVLSSDETRTTKLIAERDEEIETYQRSMNKVLSGISDLLKKVRGTSEDE